MNCDNKIYKYETIDIGKVGDIKVSISRVTDIESGKSARAILVSQLKVPLLGAINVGSLIIDLEEVDKVITALDFYMVEIKKGKPKHSPLFEYVTSNVVFVSCSFAAGAFGMWYITLHKQYHYLKSEIGGSTVKLKNKEIDNFIEMVKKAKQAEL